MRDATFSVFTDLYKLVNGLKNVEKYGFYIFQSMLEINEIWYIIPIYNILSAQISSSPRAGRETFTNPNFPLRPPGPQIASLRSEMSYDLSKKNQKNIGGQKNTVMSLAQNPRVGYQNERNFI